MDLSEFLIAAAIVYGLYTLIIDDSDTEQVEESKISVSTSEAPQQQASPVWVRD